MSWKRAGAKSHPSSSGRRCWRNSVRSMRWRICVTRRSINGSTKWTNSSTRSRRSAGGSSRMRFSGNCCRRKRRRRKCIPLPREWRRKKNMVAFKEEFPYLRGDSGQLFEFDQAWLRAAITRAANDAGYPKWWLTDHVTESIAFYLRLRNDESVVPFDQLSQTVRYVLKVIGYKEIVPHFVPGPPPVSCSLLTIAQEAGAGYELAFFDGLEKRISALVNAGADSVLLCDLQACVKHLRGAKAWTRTCDTLREEVICFVRERLSSTPELQHLRCFMR